MWTGGCQERAAILARSSLQRILSLLRQILRRAMARGLVHRNVAELCEAPAAVRPGRPSKSLTLAQAVAVLQEADAVPVMDAYVHLSILTGARTEELRAMTWADVDLDSAVPSASFVRSVRHGGDTKTATSRRRLELTGRCVEVLRRHRRWQAEQRLQAETWADTRGPVFTASRGTPLDAANVRRSFRAVVDQVEGMTGADWTPQDLGTRSCRCCPTPGSLSKKSPIRACLHPDDREGVSQGASAGATTGSGGDEQAVRGYRTAAI